MTKYIFNLALIVAACSLFSCGKCVECTQEDSDGNNYQYEIYNDNGNTQTYGDQIVEICSDNFESRKDFKDYIEDIEDEYNYECKNDFLN